MLKLVLASEPDHVGEWVYPGTWPDLATPPENALETDLIDRGAFATLWGLLDSKAQPNQALIGESLPAAGYPHYGPDGYDNINPALIEKLLAVPAHERWQVARDWATALKGKPPNKEALQGFKQLVNRLCDLVARRADHQVAVLPLR